MHGAVALPSHAHWSHSRVDRATNTTQTAAQMWLHVRRLPGPRARPGTAGLKKNARQSARKSVKANSRCDRSLNAVNDAAYVDSQMWSWAIVTTVDAKSEAGRLSWQEPLQAFTDVFSHLFSVPDRCRIHSTVVLNAAGLNDSSWIVVRQRFVPRAVTCRHNSNERGKTNGHGPWRLETDVNNAFSPEMGSLVVCFNPVKTSPKSTPWKSSFSA